MTPDSQQLESMDRKGRDVEFFRGLIERYSPSGDEEPARQYLQDELPEMGFEVEVDDIGNLHATTGDLGSDEELMLTSHMDTVKGRIPVNLDDGKLFGRGAVDAKGPLAAMFLAASRCSDADFKVTVVAVVEEERSGAGANHMVKTRESPDFLVNGEPSGWDTVTLGYRGILRLHYSVAGEVIHTARPGVNAIEDVMGFWNAVQEIENEEEGFGSLDCTATNIDSNSDGFKLESELLGNFRIPSEYTVDEVRGMVSEKAAGSEGTVEWRESTEPVMVDRSNPVVRGFLRSIRDADGSPGFSVKTGTCDMNVYAEAWDCPMVTYGPGDSNLDHTPDEHIEIEEFLASVDVLENLVEDLSG
ncbi:MAG: [LysW]-lysine hydrolase [Halobacteria archaeon]